MFQIAFEMLKRAAKVDMTFVPYSGVAPAVNALLGEHVTSVLGCLLDSGRATYCGQAPRPRHRFAVADRVGARGADRRRDPAIMTTRWTTGLGLAPRRPPKR